MEGLNKLRIKIKVFYVYNEKGCKVYCAYSEPGGVPDSAYNFTKQQVEYLKSYYKKIYPEKMIKSMFEIPQSLLKSGKPFSSLSVEASHLSEDDYDKFDNALENSCFFVGYIDRPSIYEVAKVFDAEFACGFMSGRIMQYTYHGGGINNGSDCHFDKENFDREVKPEIQKAIFEEFRSVISFEENVNRMLDKHFLPAVKIEQKFKFIDVD